MDLTHLDFCDPFSKFFPWRIHPSPHREEGILLITHQGVSRFLACSELPCLGEKGIWDQCKLGALLLFIRCQSVLSLRAHGARKSLSSPSELLSTSFFQPHSNSMPFPRTVFQPAGLLSPQVLGILPSSLLPSTEAFPPGLADDTP
jgi:hypothetical protein